MHADQAAFLRTEIVELVAESRKLELAALGAFGALYAWLYTNEPADTVAWFVPPVLALLGGVRSLALYQRIQDAARYLRGIELRMLGALPPDFNPEAEPPALIGWERHRRFDPRSPFLNSARGFWILAILAGTLMGLWQNSPCRAKPAPDPATVKVEGTLQYHPAP